MIHGGDIYRNAECIDFSANINPLGTPEMVKKAMRDSLNQVHTYPDISCEKLREKLGQFHKVKPEHVICGNGAADIIYRYVYALKPKSALVLAPCFAEYEQALHFVGTRVEHYVLDSNTFCLDECFLDVLTQELDVVFLCNPNNPTGVYYSESEILELLRLLPKNVLLFLDEAYAEFAVATDYPNLISRVQEFPNLFINRTFSKIYGLAGLRLGYGVSSPGVIRNLWKVKPPFDINLAAQAAGVAALEDLDFVQMTREKNREGMLTLKKAFEECKLEFIESQGNFLCIKIGKQAKELVAFLESRGMIVRGLSNFGLPEWIRVTVGKPEENEFFIKLLKEWLNGK